jgi:pimeloyl-ACP methyl ester carboxylesterase
MSAFVLIPGAGGVAWYWSRVVALLRDAGHDAIAVDLPGDDEDAGLPEYAELVLEAIGDRDDVVLVAQSMGGFTAPLVCAAAAVRSLVFVNAMMVRSLVFVNAMIPVAGETAGAWGANTGATEARVGAAEAGGYGGDFDLQTYFLHDVAPEVAAEGEPHQRPEADAAFASVCDFDAWPAIPTRVLCGADDRLFPVEFQRTVARERLGIEADVLPGGHLIALSQPALVVDYLLQG